MKAFKWTTFSHIGSMLTSCLIVCMYHQVRIEGFRCQCAHVVDTNRCELLESLEWL